MKVSLCVVASGTYATVNDGRVESTVRLPNGCTRVARDLEDIATQEESNAKAALRRAERLRAAIAHLNAGNAAALQS